MSVTGMGAWRSGLGPFMPGTMHLPHYHCYRCALGHEDHTKCGIACANYLKIAIKSQTSNRVAAVIAEAIQGIGGIVVAPPDYFKVLKPILDENGILLIVDEVQTAFGRTGKWFAMEHYGVDPDVITLAKALGGGMPRAEVADEFPGPDFSTFGGNPVSCRAALAGIEVVEEENLMENAAKVGQHLHNGLVQISKAHPCFDDVQGLGLMIGGEIVTDKKTRTPAPNEMLVTLMDEALKENVLIGRGGFYYNRVRFQPPLSLSKEQAERALEAFEKALTTAEKSLVR
jgi:4-aminobutyrate aminotransferase/(S)-3-amino-2-methylpropionate transaminase